MQHTSEDTVRSAALALLALLGAPGESAATDRTLLIGLANAPNLAAAHVDAGTLKIDAASHLLRQSTVIHHLLRSRAREASGIGLANALEDVTERLCIDFGFERVMAFEVGETTLDPSTTRFSEAEEWSEEIHAQALASPPRLDLAVRESEVVDAQRTVLVDDPQIDPRTWKPIVNPLRTISYAVAPVVVAGNTVATLHVDCWFSKRSLTATDKETLGLISDEVSFRLNSRHQRRRRVLTKQQVHVMELLAQGFTNDAIARNLFVSSETVKSHVHNIYRRLDVSNRAEAVGRFFDLDHQS